MTRKDENHLKRTLAISSFNDTFDLIKSLKEQLLNSERINKSLECCGNCKNVDYDGGIQMEKNVCISTYDVCKNWTPSDNVVNKLRGLQADNN
jgi:hypothetical protein